VLDAVSAGAVVAEGRFELTEPIGVVVLVPGAGVEVVAGAVVVEGDVVCVVVVCARATPGTASIAVNATMDGEIFIGNHPFETRGSEAGTQSLSEGCARAPITFLRRLVRHRRPHHAMATLLITKMFAELEGTSGAGLDCASVWWRWTHWRVT
jgi:hypothetical protein